jgi:hypothetical protein
MNNRFSNQTPVEIDVEMLKQSSVEFNALYRISQFEEAMKIEAFNANRDIWSWGKSDVFGRSRYNVIATGEEVTRDKIRRTIDAMMFAGSHAMSRYNDLLNEQHVIYSAARSVLDQIDIEFERRGGWSRYWLVVSSSGHIHRDTECHTCNKGKKPTSFALYPMLSGFTTADAVAKLGAALCSFCFPEAPVEHREQVKISKAATVKLLETGDVAEFDKAIAKQKKNDAAKCPGSNVEGTRYKDGSRFIKCSCCDFVGMLNWNSRTEKLPRHKPYYNKATQIQDKGSPS